MCYKLIYIILYNITNELFIYGSIYKLIHILTKLLIELMEVIMNNIEKMLETVSQKLGTTPENLRKSLEKGDLKSAISNMPPKDAQKLNMILNNKKLMEQFAKSPQAQEILKKAQNK